MAAALPPKPEGAPRSGGRVPALPSEDEPEYDSSLCTLDWYSSDLNLAINTTDFCSAVAMSARSGREGCDGGVSWGDVDDHCGDVGDSCGDVGDNCGDF